MSDDRPTYRERREARAERRREWADGREAKAEAAFAAVDLREEVSGIPFGQPILAGHHSQRRHQRAIERSQAALTRGVEHSSMARKHTRSADTIERQLETSIYDDDPDAIERLTERIADLEAQRDVISGGVKAYNRSVKAGSPDLDLLPPKLRSNVTHPALVTMMTRPDGTVRPGMTSNLSANIARNRQRLERLRAAVVEPTDDGLGAGYCPECGGELAANEHGQGCGYVAQAMLDYAFDHHGGHR